ncbi:response regulator [Arthrobacter sp. AL12]|uniref:response regulator n=1 Tax=Arthrobacter sp. AL12 TaxID=3042241 RepID=UPI00249A8C8E|nr:response regulator [Arthrobacter sp. AL12]MDI3213948.1 response regulator [Arthrobacter sp. AL12]
MDNPRRILLVDDDEGIREVARTVLEMVGGYDVETAASGLEGLEKARTSPPDAIVLDVMMPGLDGPATFVLLQEQPATRGVPVIFLTAKTQAADRSRFASIGVAGMLSKPFDPMALCDQIAGILGWQS